MNLTRQLFLPFVTLFACFCLNSCQTTADGGPSRTIIICEQKKENVKLRMIGVSREENPNIFDFRYRNIADSGLASPEYLVEAVIDEIDSNDSVSFVGVKDDLEFKKLVLNPKGSQLYLANSEITIECNFHQILAKDPLQRRASCNGIGTPAQGWYLSGKLIQHDQNCHLSEMRCSFPNSQSEKWVVYNHPFPRELNLEKCLDQKDCKTSHELFELSAVHEIKKAKCGRPAKPPMTASK